VISASEARRISYLSLYRHIGPESLESGPIELSGPPQSAITMISSF
jgi:hypothetical protein